MNASVKQSLEATHARELHSAKLAGVFLATEFLQNRGRLDIGLDPDVLDFLIETRRRLARSNARKLLRKQNGSGVPQDVGE